MAKNALKIKRYLTEMINAIPADLWERQDGRLCNVRSLMQHIVRCLNGYYAEGEGSAYDWNLHGECQWWLDVHPRITKAEMAQAVSAVLDFVNRKEHRPSIEKQIYANQHTFFHMGQLSQMIKDHGGNPPSWDECLGDS